MSAIKLPRSHRAVVLNEDAEKSTGGLDLSGRRPGNEVVRTLAGQRFRWSTPDRVLFLFSGANFTDALIKCLRFLVKAETSWWFKM